MMNTAIYPSAEEFQPDRWLDGDPVLDRYLCSFSRGSRACIGMKYVPLPLLCIFRHSLLPGNFACMRYPSGAVHYFLIFAREFSFLPMS